MAIINGLYLVRFRHPRRCDLTVHVRSGMFVLLSCPLLKKLLRRGVENCYFLHDSLSLVGLAQWHSAPTVVQVGMYLFLLVVPGSRGTCGAFDRGLTFNQAEGLASS